MMRSKCLYFTLLKILVVAVGVSSPKLCEAQVSVNSALFTFRAGGRPVQNVSVSNAAVVPVYVKVQVERIKDLAHAEPEYQLTEELLVSPKNFSIGPNGTRTVRMLIKNLPADKEVAYRVLFIPQQNEFGEEQLRGAKFTKGSLTLKVATGVGMLVFAQPKEPKQQLTVTRDEKGVRLVSEGNVHVLISDGVVCPSSVSLNEEEQSKAWSSRDNSEIVAKGCAGFRGGRIHSGRTKEIAAALGSTVYVAKRDDSTGNFNRIEIPQEAKP